MKNEVVKSIEDQEAIAILEINKISEINEIEVVRSKFLGYKGSVPNLLTKLRYLSPNDRVISGEAINLVKKNIENSLKEKELLLKKEVKNGS